MTVVATDVDWDCVCLSDLYFRARRLGWVGLGWEGNVSESAGLGKICDLWQ